MNTVLHSQRVSSGALHRSSHEPVGWSAKRFRLGPNYGGQRVSWVETLHRNSWYSVGDEVCLRLQCSRPNISSAASSVEYSSVQTEIQYSIQSRVEVTQSSQRQEGSSSKTQQSTYGPSAHVTATGRVVAIGDIHGDIQKLLDCLKISGLIREDDHGIRWIGGDATVVQLGDVLDRGDAEISTILLLRELDKQARQDGGAVHMLNGNHESLNVAGDFRYVTRGAFWESAMAAGLSEDDALRSKEAILQARWALYRPGGVMAKELSRNPTVLIVNNEIVFAHGGLLPHHVKYGVQRINDEVAKWMKGADCTDGSAPSPPFTAMGDSNSVMWNRTFGKERCSPYDRIQMKRQLDATLQQLGAKAMVVGHTPQMTGLNAECNGRIWRVDVGMSSGVLNAEAQVLEFSKDESGNLQASLLTPDFTPYL